MENVERELFEFREQLQLLPAFATFIIDQHLDEFLRLSRKLLREFDVPLLRRMSVEEGDALADKSNTELLSSLANRTPAWHIRNAIDRWRTSQFPRVQRNHFVVEDVTRIGHVRKLSFLKLLPKYTLDIEKIVVLIGEIDAYILEYTATTLHNFVGIIDGRMHEQLERLEESEQLYKNAERIAHIGNWKWVVKEDAMQWTDELYRIFGLAPSSIAITRDAYIGYVHPDDREVIQERIAQTLKTREPFELFHRIVAGDGATRILHILGEASVNEAGEVYQLIGSAQDVTIAKETERKLLEQQKILEQRTRELQESNASLEEFAYVTSHDLKEPLRKIFIYMGLLEDSMQSGGQHEKAWFGRILASAVRMRNLIDDLLALSLLSAEKKTARHNLKEVFDEARQVFEQKIAETQAVIECSDLPEAPVIYAQFGQLFQNLISNALKFVRPGTSPVITVSHRYLAPRDAVSMYNLPPVDHHEIRVSDNGIGFEKQYAERIFSVFEQLHSKDAYEGTGIGLAICKKIVKNHGGIISATSDAGRGATFIIVIPDS